MKVLVIGGGAAGLMAAVTAAKNGADVTLVEKNEKFGKKIYITGKGRCNVTNNCEIDEFLDNVISNKKFLLSSLHSFSPADTINFFESNGLHLKTERGNRVFPCSDKASDITKVFEKLLKKYNVKTFLSCKAIKFEVKNSKISGIHTSCGNFTADKYILATGGISYPTTGSTGDGLKMSNEIGHSIIKPVAGLVGLKADSPKELSGLTLKNVDAKILENDKIVVKEFGELLFTHHGVSGPVILTVSSKINRKEFSKLKLSIDLKPALSEKELDLRIQRDFSQVLNKQFSNSLDNLLPRSLISVILKKSEIPLNTKVNQITCEQRQRLVKLLKDLQFDLYGTENVVEAIITCGGIDVKEINPATMQSKKFANLYFAGEIIDVDALTGGFNLQVAFSTAYLAGRSCTE